MNTSQKIVLIAAIEIVVSVLFFRITPTDKGAKKIDLKSLLKGWIERFFLTYSLISGFPHALTLFGALKLGTRLKSADNETTEEGRKRKALITIIT